MDEMVLYYTIFFGIWYYIFSEKCTILYYIILYFDLRKRVVTLMLSLKYSWKWLKNTPGGNFRYGHPGGGGGAKRQDVYPK